MRPNPGDQVYIRPGMHMYPDGWKLGEDPIRFPQGTLGIFLKVSGNTTPWETREFWRVVTEVGVGEINSTFVRVVE